MRVSALFLHNLISSQIFHLLQRRDNANHLSNQLFVAT